MMDEFSLIEHLETVHLHRKIKCGACKNSDEVFSVSSNSERQSVTEHDYCLKESAENDRSNAGLIQHLKVQHANQKIKCAACNLVFSVSSNVKRRALEQSNTKEFESEEVLLDCGFKAKDRSTLKEHRDVEHPGGISKCCVCKKAFYNLSNLRRHNWSIHNANRFTYKCGICNKLFRLSYSLKRHKSSVHGGLKYKCSKCNSLYTSSGSLRRHTLTVHDGQRYECPHCHLQVKRKSNFDRHLKRIHSNDNPLKPSKQICALCNCSLHSRILVLNHYANHHQVELVKHDLEFDTLEQFFAWKEETENSTKSKFILKKRYNGVTIFRCNRSGLGKNKIHDRKRRPRAKGFTKLGFICPAEIRVRRNNSNSNYTAFFLETHVGHDTINATSPICPRPPKSTRLKLAIDFSSNAQTEVNPKRDEIDTANADIFNSLQREPLEIFTPAQIENLTREEIEMFSPSEIENLAPKELETFDTLETENFTSKELEEIAGLSEIESTASVTASNELIKYKEKLLRNFTIAFNLISTVKEAKVVDKLLEPIIPSILNVKTASNHNSLRSIENRELQLR